MQKRIYPIWHEDKKIWFTDWSNLNNDDDAIAAIRETSEFVVELGEYNLLEIIDIRGSYATPSILKALKHSAKITKPFGKKKVMVGLKGSKKILLSLVNRFVNESIIALDTIEEAKEWLVND